MSEQASQEERNRVAREKYGKDYDQLDTHEKRSVGGYIGTEHRMAHAGGGGGTQQEAKPAAAHAEAHHRGEHVSPQELNRIAHEKYGKDYDSLDTHEKRSVAGTIGGEMRRDQLGHEGYSEMGHKGGEARRG